MTLAELERAIDSKKRINKLQNQQKAANDYILADLIGRSIARLYSKEAKYPEIYDVYPQLFNKAEMEQAKQNAQIKLSTERMQQFAESFNKRYKSKEANNK